MTRRVVIQKGHCFRQRGFTGTADYLGRTEQNFAHYVGDVMHDLLGGYADIEPVIVLADPPAYPDCDVFVSLHQDGSIHRAARGASVGYPRTGDGGKLGQIWKALYQLHGWPSGFRPDNYTPALSGYYAFRRVNARAKLLIEHGFATNQTDTHWMWDNIDAIAAINTDAIARYLNATPAPTETETMALELIIDTEGNHAGEHWIVGGQAPIDITNSTARATHVADFTAANAVKRLRYGGDIVRKSYPGQ